MRAITAGTIEPPILVRPDDSPLHWHEAVAIVRSVADAVVEGRLGSVPSSGELALERDGSLHVPPGLAARASDAAQSAAAMRQLLRDLMPADAPAELRGLGDGQGSIRVSTPVEFRDALAFFERPSSARDRQALAARLEKIQQERQLEEEIERLKRKARADDHSRPEEDAPPQSGPAKKLSGKTLAALAALGAAGGVAIALVVLPASAEKAVVTGTSAAAASDTGIVGTLRKAARSAFGKTTQAEAPDPPVVKAEPAGPQPSHGRPAARGPITLSQAGTAAPHPRRLELAYLAAQPRPVLEWSAPRLELPADVTRTFNRGDADVEPPVLVRPHLPTRESVGLPRDQAGTVEVVVTPDGRVETVRLLRTTAERRYYDTMILAAVKAWIFRPASRSGQPVRYRLQITLT